MSTEIKTNDKKSILENMGLEKHGFNLSEAVDEVKLEFQVGDVADKAKSSAKLLGKSAFNLGFLAGKVGLSFIKELPQHLAKQADSQVKNNSELTDEQRNTLSEYSSKYTK
jgi:hypothetical protein